MASPTTYSRAEIIKLLNSKSGIAVRPIDNDEDVKSIATVLGFPIPQGRPGDLVWYWQWPSAALPGAVFSFALLWFVGGTVRNAHVGAPDGSFADGRFVVTDDDLSLPLLIEPNGRQWHLLNGTEIVPPITPAP
jgi:hypothetical protein